MKFFVLIVVSTLLLATVDRSLAYPKEINAKEISKQVYFVNHQFYLDNQILKSHKKTSIMIIKHPYGKKPRVLRAERYLNNDYNDGVTKSKDLIIFLSGNLKGTGILAREFIDETKSLEIQMWLPALRKVRRMAEPSKNLGYSSADIAFLEEAKLRRLSDDAFELMETKVMNFEFGHMELNKMTLNRFTKQLPRKYISQKAEVYLLKATPKEDAWYDYRVDYVDVKHFTTYRSHFYIEDKIVKTVDRQWQKVKGIDDERAYMWSYWYSINPVTKFETINFIPEKIVQNNVKNVKATFWSERTLRRIKR